MTLRFSRDFRQLFKYEIWWKSVQWKMSCSLRTDGRTDDEANSRSSQSLRPRLDRHQFVSQYVPPIQQSVGTSPQWRDDCTIINSRERLWITSVAYVRSPRTPRSGVPPDIRNNEKCRFILSGFLWATLRIPVTGPRTQFANNYVIGAINESRVAPTGYAGPWIRF